MKEQCPKCGSNNISENYAAIESLGMKCIKGVAKASNWGFKVISHGTENFGHPGKIATFASRVVTKAIDSGTKMIPTNVTRCHCNKCGHNWGYQIRK